MDDNKKMYPSSLPKSTELTKINQNSTELCRMPFSRDIALAKSNITRSKSNITSAKPNVRRFNNGGGGGGGDNGNGGPGGGDDGTTIEIFLSTSSGSGSSYGSAQGHSQWKYNSSQAFSSHQSSTYQQRSAAHAQYTQNYNSQSASEYSPQQNVASTQGYGSGQGNGPRQNYPAGADNWGQHHNNPARRELTNEEQSQKDFLSFIVIIFLAIVCLQLLLGILNSIVQSFAQINAGSLLLILLAVGSFFLFKNFGYGLLSKDGEYKGLPANLVTELFGKVLSQLNAWYSGTNTLTQTKGTKENLIVVKSKAKDYNERII